MVKSLFVLFLILGSAVSASPRFYALEESLEAGMVTVRACDQAPSGDLNCGEALEVEASDLEAFTQDLSRYVNISKIMMRGGRGDQVREKRAGAGIIASLSGAIGGIFGFLITLDYYPSGKGLYLGLAGSAVVLAASAAGFVASLKLGIQKPENTEDTRLVVDEALLEEFRQGMVSGASEELFRDEIMQRFTDFLDEFGRPAG